MSRLPSNKSGRCSEIEGKVCNNKNVISACLLRTYLKWRRRSHREVSILNIEENRYKPGEASAADDSEFIYQILTFSTESYCNHIK